MANVSNSGPRPLALPSTDAAPSTDAPKSEGKIGLDGKELPVEPKSTSWSPAAAANAANAQPKPEVPYKRSVDLPLDFAFGAVGGAANDYRTARAAGVSSEQSVSNLIPNLTHPQADFSGYGLGAGGNSLSSAAGRAAVEHNAVHIGIGAGVYLMERARGATRTEAALGSFATGVGIEVGQSLQKMHSTATDAGRFDVSDVVRTSSGALVGMAVETAIGAVAHDKTDNPIFNLLSHITAFDIGKDSAGGTKVSAQAHWNF